MTTSGGSSAEPHRSLSRWWRRHRTRWSLPLVIVAVIVVLAVIDHLGSHQIRQVDQPAASVLEPAANGTVSVALDRPWEGFNPNTPAGAVSATPTLLDQVLPSAYVISPTKLVPVVNSALLLSVETLSTAPLVIQYQINPAAVWSDGVPVRATDFIYAWQSQRGTGVDVNGQADEVASTLGYQDISSITGSHGDETVTVHFTQPFTDWRLLFNHMVPAHIAEKVGWNEGFARFSPSVDLSAGPYVLSQVSGREAVLKTNPRWWGTKPVLRQVNVFYAPTSAAWTALLGGTNQSVAAPRYAASAAINAASSLPNTVSTSAQSLGFVELEFNLSAPTTARTVVREALAHMIDRTGIISQTVGVVQPSTGLMDDHLAVPGQTQYQPSSAANSYAEVDLATASTLLKSAGYTLADNGAFENASGKPLTIRLDVEVNDPWVVATAGEVERELRAAGVSVEPFNVPGPVALAQDAAANTFDAALVDRTASPFLTETAPWFSQDPTLQVGPYSQNWSNFNDPGVNVLFHQASRALNPDTGALDYAQVDDQLWDNMVGLPLFVEPGFVANGVQVADVTYNPSEDGIFWNLPLWTTLEPQSTKGKATVTTTATGTS